MTYVSYHFLFCRCIKWSMLGVGSDISFGAKIKAAWHLLSMSWSSKRSLHPCAVSTPYLSLPNFSHIHFSRLQVCEQRNQKNLCLRRLPIIVSGEATWVVTGKATWVVAEIAACVLAGEVADVYLNLLRCWAGAAERGELLSHACQGWGKHMIIYACQLIICDNWGNTPGPVTNTVWTI